jgi:YD repeat-containing protein
MTDFNGAVTVNAYDPRQRITSSGTSSRTTNYTYDAAGQLTRITLPSGSWTGFEYDAAQRQTAVFDSLGNRVQTTLNNAGQPTAQTVKGSAGALKRQAAQSLDALSRVQQTTSAP